MSDLLDALSGSERQELDAYRFSGLSPEDVSVLSSSNAGHLNNKLVYDVLELLETMAEDIKKYHSSWSNDSYTRVVNILHKIAFDWCGFSNGEFVAHLDDRDKYEQFMSECKRRGMQWCSGRAIVPTEYMGYSTYGTQLCIKCSELKLSYADCEYFESKGIKIFEYVGA